MRVDKYIGRTTVTRVCVIQVEKILLWVDHASLLVTKGCLVRHSDWDGCQEPQQSKLGVFIQVDHLPCLSTTVCLCWAVPECLCCLWRKIMEQNSLGMVALGCYEMALACFEGNLKALCPSQWLKWRLLPKQELKPMTLGWDVLLSVVRSGSSDDLVTLTLLVFSTCCVRARELHRR